MKKVNQYIDVISGIFWIIAAAAVYVMSMSIVQRASVKNTVGPQFFPKIVAVLIAVAGGMTALNGIRDVKKGVGETGSFPQERQTLLAVGSTMLLLIVYVSLLKWIGFVLASALYLFAQLCLLQTVWKKNLVKNLILAVLVAVVSYMIFRYGFSLTLPTGYLF